jgi:t-SNARE complex subunit (syntaxin)
MTTNSGAVASLRGGFNPFTPGSSSSSDGDEDILSSTITLEEGLRRSQLRGMKNVQEMFVDVHAAYRALHGEALAQQEKIDTVEEHTLKTALLTGETVTELRKTKDRKDKRLKMRLYCIGIFFFIVFVWLAVVLHLPARIRHSGDD